MDWYPWGAEAFADARARDCPILLSIGYSACHWCHVMERESFEDPTTAALMNTLFVNVKVDREERPDVDQIYMKAVQALTGRGGWPLTVFLKAGGEPFFGGTYFPPERRHGMPAFQEVLTGIARAFVERPEDVARAAVDLTAVLERSTRPASDQDSEAPPPKRLTEAVRRIAEAYDPRHGGFGGAPKFPQPVVLDFLLEHAAWSGNGDDLQMATHTLRRMAAGGMQDHLGGGFHRYAVDERWLVPHFEKMLYDNALLARVYLRAWQHTGDPVLRSVCEATLDYVLNDLCHPDGGFYSARDADSEGEEGRYYVWTADEVEALLGPNASVFRRAYDVTPRGNFEGRNILHTPHPLEAVAEEAGLPVPALEESLGRSRALLAAARAGRVEPLRDEKILASWTGFTVRSLAEASGVLERPDYLAAALAAGTFLRGPLSPQGRLRHSHLGVPSQTPAFLDDVAAAGNAYLALYEATLDASWLWAALASADEVEARFWDSDEQTLFDTARDAETLVVRPREIADSAVPSGSSLAAELWLRVVELTGDARRRPMIGRLLAPLGDERGHPLAHGRLLAVLERFHAAPLEVVLVGPAADPSLRALHEVALRSRAHSRTLLHHDPSEEPPPPFPGGELLPLLEGRTLVEGRPAAYVCWHHTCSLPITEPDALAEELERVYL